MVLPRKEISQGGTSETSLPAGGRGLFPNSQSLRRLLPAGPSTNRRVKETACRREDRRKLFEGHRREEAGEFHQGRHLRMDDPAPGPTDGPGENSIQDAGVAANRNYFWQ